jgi:parvulin-like peptidyl-prolyl isomerase
MLPAEVEAQAFEASEGAVIGPFRENSLWTVYKVYAVTTPKLTDALKNVIRDQIFSEWLREQVCTVPA